MSEDEKEAIKTVEDLKTMKWYSHAFDNGTEILTQEEKSDIDIVLNLIEKQQKEIEQEKEKNEKLVDKTIQYDKPLEKLQKDTIWKDKIKEKIKEINNRRIEDGQCELALHGFQREAKIDVLKELLEEN